MRYTEEQKKEFVQSWQETNLSRKQYSISNSLSYPSFLNWTKKYIEEPTNPYIKLEDNNPCRTKIVLPNGVMIQTEQSLTVGLLKSLSNV